MDVRVSITFFTISDKHNEEEKHTAKKTIIATYINIK